MSVAAATDAAGGPRFMAGLEGLLAARPALPDWIHARRREAEERFRDLGLPTRAQEAWRFTDLGALSGMSFSACPPPLPHAGRDRLLHQGLPGSRLLVSLDGHHAPHLGDAGSLPAGVIVCSLGEAIELRPDLVEEHLGRLAPADSGPFAALALAMLADGAFVFIPGGVEVEAPIQLLFLSEGDDHTPGARFPRTLVIAGAHSRFSIIETHAGSGGRYLSVPVTELVLGPGARIDHTRLQREGAAAIHIANQQAELARGSSFSSRTVAVGSSLARCDLGAVLTGEDATCELGGLSVTGDRQHVDTQVLVDHRQPHCRSRQVFKGILDGASRAVFNGRIVVRKPAQRTDARQSNRNLLLSRSSVVNSNPQLEIHADDVRCTHGSTVGALDRNALFYLRARGIPEPEARSILTRAFAAEVIDTLPLPVLRRWAEEALRRQLSASEGLLREG